jgi:4-diphosphocytidyl-2-C-methyl-D-erythritol kinase
MADQLVLSAPAKINLSLDVLGKREDGYHQVEMVMQSVELADRISLERTANNTIRVLCPHPYVPSGSENLAWKAACLLRDRYGSDSRGVIIRIQKNIPVAAGLAGGSSDAAAVLRGLNELWKLNLSDKGLAEAGLSLGADVPFCLKGGTALAQGIGEQLTPLPSPPKLWVLLFKPNVGVSTAEVYKNYDGSLVRKRPDTNRLVWAIESGNLPELAGAMANVLESVTFSRLPMLLRLKQKALELGAMSAMMSGSGPTVFALTPEYRKAVAIFNGLKHQVEFAYITTFKEGY